MKSILLSLTLLFVPFTNAALTESDVEKYLPELHGLWDTPVEIKGVSVFPQKGLFDMEGIAYSAYTLSAKRSGKYVMWNSDQKFKAPIINKIRISAGMAPVSKDDNEFVRICRFDMNSNLYYEMSVSQANKISDMVPLFSPAENCLLGADTKDYWQTRYRMFYDNYGNQKGVR